MDNSNSIDGFKEGQNPDGPLKPDYEHDLNGNMTQDWNKGILEITYNHLNLPTSIKFDKDGLKTIEYLYNALGVKLRKVVTDKIVVPDVYQQTDYLGGFQYVDDKLQFFPTAEGYVSVIDNEFRYVYNYTDHLGNIRLSYSRPKEGYPVEILEENHYYPFGMKHSDYAEEKYKYVKETDGNGFVVLEAVERSDYQYKFLGQERQDELGLNWDTFRHRNYDYAIARFFGVDPIAEEYMSISTYQFAHNNPVWKIEIEGLEGKETQGIDISNHEPVKVKNNPNLGFVGAGLVEVVSVKVAVEKKVAEVAVSAVNKTKSVVTKVLATAGALLSDYMSPNFGGNTDEGNWPSVGGFKVDENLRIKDFKIEEKTIEETGIKRINSEIDELIETSTPGEKTKGKSTLYEREGGMDAANKEFDMLNPSNVKEIEGGRVGTLPGGKTVNVRNKSSDGRPTLEIQDGKKKTKFRYDE